jgi:hypothetical protein
VHQSADVVGREQIRELKLGGVNQDGKRTQVKTVHVPEGTYQRRPSPQEEVNPTSKI